MKAGTAQIDAKFLKDTNNGVKTLIVRTELKFIQSFTKNLNKDAFVNIFMAQDAPIVFSFMLGHECRHSFVRYLIAPILEDL